VEPSLAGRNLSDEVDQVVQHLSSQFRIAAEVQQKPRQIDYDIAVE
jgi:hypothetical protein